MRGANAATRAAAAECARVGVVCAGDQVGVKIAEQRGKERRCCCCWSWSCFPGTRWSGRGVAASRRNKRRSSERWERRAAWLPRVWEWEWEWEWRWGRERCRCGRREKARCTGRAPAAHTPGQYDDGRRGKELGRRPACGAQVVGLRVRLRSSTRSLFHRLRAVRHRTILYVRVYTYCSSIQPCTIVKSSRLLREGATQHEPPIQSETYSNSPCSSRVLATLSHREQ